MTEGNNAAQGPGFIDKLKQGAVSQLNSQKDRATEGMNSVVQAVRHSTEQLREEHATIASYVDEAVSQVDRLARNLKQKDTRELVSDAQRFARRNPAIFVGSAFAIGLVAARFLKSSGDGTNGRDWQDTQNYRAVPRNIAPVPVGSSGFSHPAEATESASTAHTPASRRRSRPAAGPVGLPRPTPRSNDTEKF
jgi:ElaB/YqjD/DUF883 family membrane-anchored ribosome-binding protein